jgi:hypothetical protein
MLNYQRVLFGQTHLLPAWHLRFAWLILDVQKKLTIPVSFYIPLAKQKNNYTI